MGNFGGGKLVNFLFQALNFFFYFGKLFEAGFFPLLLVGSEEGRTVDGFVQVLQFGLYLLSVFFN